MTLVHKLPEELKFYPERMGVRSHSLLTYVVILKKIGWQALVDNKI